MIRTLIALPFLVLLVLFALSNPQTVTLGIWPTDYSIDVPLSLAVLTGMGIAFILGAFLLWFSMLAAQSRARRAERTVRRLQAQLDDLRSRPAPATSRAAPSGGPALGAPSERALLTAR